MQWGGLNPAGRVFFFYKRKFLFAQLYILFLYLIYFHPSGITRLNKRACQDAAVLGLGFLKLDGTCSPFGTNKLLI